MRYIQGCIVWGQNLRGHNVRGRIVPVHTEDRFAFGTEPVLLLRLYN
jgi:hypothetical protein